MTSRLKLSKLLITLLLLHCTLAQEAGPALHGMWTATAGAQVFRGSWSAEISQRSPDTAQGSWTLLNDSGEVVLQGTWSAKRTGSQWQGTWRARMTQTQSFGGTWNADMTGSKGKTFADLLQRTLEKQVAGSWQTGSYGGNWWLKGLNSKNGRQ